jgi:hypothetical protein
MKPGFKFFWVYNVILEDWCRRYDIEEFIGLCANCESPVVADKPFAGPNDIRGLGADECHFCGSTDTPFGYVGGCLKELG